MSLSLVFPKWSWIKTECPAKFRANQSYIEIASDASLGCLNRKKITYVTTCTDFSGTVPIFEPDIPRTRRRSWVDENIPI